MTIQTAVRPDQDYTVKEVSEIFNQSPRTTWRLIRDGKIKVRRYTQRVVRIGGVEIERFRAEAES